MEIRNSRILPASPMAVQSHGQGSAYERETTKTRIADMENTGTRIARQQQSSEINSAVRSAGSMLEKFTPARPHAYGFAEQASVEPGVRYQSQRYRAIDTYRDIAQQQSEPTGGVLLGRIDTYA